MIINFIFSVLLLVVGFAFSALILLFGVRFCKDDGKLSDDATWKDFILQLVKSYPLWVWLLIFFVFQPTIVHIIDVWATPSLWIDCEWIPKFSDFIGFISIVIFFIIFHITDNHGKLKSLKKSE